MKRIFLIIALALLGVTGSGQVLADRGHRGHVGVGVGLVVNPYWGSWYMAPPFYHPYYPPVVIERADPPVYIEQPVSAETPAAPTGYWYFCQSSRAYYPQINECPEGWVRVLPRSSDKP